MTPTQKPKFHTDNDLSDDEKSEKALVPEFEKIISLKQQGLEETLKNALDSYSDLNIAQSAKEFRKIANDLKLMELLITDKGKHNSKNSLNDLTGKQWLQHTKSWVIIDGKPGDISKQIKNHPASYPPSLAEYFISYFTKAGGWVFDPFMGIGSTAQAALITKRNCFGIELNPEYAKFTRERIQKSIDDQLKSKIFTGDSRNTLEIWKENNIPPIDFIITSPPYWNMLKKSRGGVKSKQKQRIEQGFDEDYGNSEFDLGNIDDLSQYLDSLVNIFKDLKNILKPKAHLMIILQNCRTKEGKMEPLAWNFALKMEKHYKLLQEFIWLQDQKFMGIWGWPTTYVSNVHHHYCLVFQNS